MVLAGHVARLPRGRKAYRDAWMIRRRSLSSAGISMLAVFQTISASMSK